MRGQQRVGSGWMGGWVNGYKEKEEKRMDVWIDGGSLWAGR